jgi:S-DNA-T family DNA segregation ATPase FtsK/SpoIIIE
VLASQSISASAGAELDQATLNQFGMRIALAMNESDATRILARENDAAKFITRAGEAIFNAQNGLPGGNVLFQIAYVSDADVAAHVRAIRKHAEQHGLQRKPFLFEGNRPASITDNQALAMVAANPPSSPPRAIPVYVGEPAALQEAHTAYRMRRQAGDNLLMVGQHDETLFSIFLTAVASWAAQQPPDTADITVFNLANDDDEMVRSHIGVLQQLPQSVRIGRNAAVIPWLDGLSAELDRRRADDQSEAPRPRTLVAFYGIQRARDLVREGYSGSAATKKLLRLIHDGPESGIAFTVAADMYANLLRILEAKDLTDFGGRIAVMGGDAGKILGDHAGSFKVRENYGVLYEPEKPDVLQKFRTYGLAQTQWIAQFISREHESWQK